MSRTHRDTGFYGRPVRTLNNVLAQRSSSHEEQHTQHAYLYILNNLLADSPFIRKTNITFCLTRILSDTHLLSQGSHSCTLSFHHTHSQCFADNQEFQFRSNVNTVFCCFSPLIFLRSQQTHDRKNGSENQRSEVWVSHAQSRHTDT